MASVVQGPATSIRARGGLTSGLVGSLSCRVRDWIIIDRLVTACATGHEEPLDDLIRRDRSGANPCKLRAAVVETVGPVREQWSLEVVEYNHDGNNDENNDESNDASLYSFVSEFSFRGACYACFVFSVLKTHEEARNETDEIAQNDEQRCQFFRNHGDQITRESPQGRESRGGSVARRRQYSGVIKAKFLQRAL